MDGEQFGQIKKNWCNSEVSQNKDFLIFLILKKKLFYLLVFVGQLNMFNKNKENDIDNGQKDRKLKEEQFEIIKKNWCNS